MFSTSVAGMGKCLGILIRKKEAALSLEDEFKKEGNDTWFDMLVAQSDYADKSFEDYEKEMARYIYVVRKTT